MKPKYLVWGIIIFGVLFAITAPYYTKMALRAKYQTDIQTESTQKEAKNEVAVNDTASKKIEKVKEEVTSTEVAYAPAVKKEEPKPEVKQEQPKQAQPQPQPQPVQAPADPVVYDGMTLNQLSAKLDRSLKSSLTGKGSVYAKYSIEYGVDPYLAVAISLHETGCNWSCSNLVKTKNNVGGLFGKGGALSFSTLDEGIRYYISYIKTNYVAKGKTKSIEMTGYAANTKTWSDKVERYYTKVKNA